MDDMMTVGDKDTDEFVRKIGIELLSRKRISGLNSLTREQRVFICVYLFDYELYQGGADQFFFNSSGNFANEVVNALEEIVAHNSVELYKPAIALFPNGHVPDDVAERRQLLRQLCTGSHYNQICNDLTDSYCKDPDQIIQRLYEYVERKQSSFSSSPINKASH